MPKDPAEEPLMSLRPLNDLQRLLFAETEIKDLKKQLSTSRQELGECQSLMQELEHKLRTQKDEVQKEVLESVKGQHIHSLVEKNKLLQERIVKLRSEKRKLKNEKDQLFQKVVELGLNLRQWDP